MAKLNEREQEFVRSLMVTDANWKAALMAGYGRDSETAALRENAARVAAWRLMRDPDVLAAVREQAALSLHAGALLGAKVLTEIALDPMHKDRLKAAKELLMHSGFLQVSEHRVVVEDTRTDKEQYARAIELANRLGIDPQKLLGSAGIVDAEFTEVEQEDDWTWQPG